MNTSDSEINAILEAIRQGDDPANNLLWSVLYQELRRIAHQRMQREKNGHTLSTTGLLHEAYLKLVGSGKAKWNDRQHFYAFASHVMRQILIDHARTSKSKKRNGGKKPIPIEDALFVSAEDSFGTLDQDGLIDLHNALLELEQINPRWAKVVECNYFGGMTFKEIAEVIGFDSRTAERDWKRAKNWLFKRLKGPDEKLDA